MKHDDIDYELVEKEAMELQHTALKLVIDPKTPASALDAIYKHLEVSEMLMEIAEDAREVASESVKDELESAQAKLLLYHETKQPQWLQAAQSEAHHADLYMKMYKDESMRAWYDSIMADIMELSKPTA